MKSWLISSIFRVIKAHNTVDDYTYSVALTLSDMLYLHEYGSNIALWFARFLKMESDFIEEFCLEFNKQFEELIENNKAYIYEWKDKLNNKSDKTKIVQNKVYNIQEFVKQRLENPINEIRL